MEIGIDWTAGSYPRKDKPPVTCTKLDHSEFKVSTNYWNSLEWFAEKKWCVKCGRPSYRQWLDTIMWESRDPGYWRNIFRAAAAADRGLDGGLPFFYMWEAPDPVGQRLIRGDENDENPKPVETRLVQNDRGSWRRSAAHNINTRGLSSLVAYLRWLRYERRRPKAKENYYDKLQPHIDAALRAAKEENGHTCIDNTRFAAVSSRKDMRRYRKQKDNGCCGSHDEEVTIRGFRFMIGFNYGH